MKRSAVWELVWWPRSRIARTRSPAKRAGRVARANATTREQHEAEQGDERGLGAQQHRDRDDGSELPPRARAHEEGAEPGVELAAVPEDRQQGPEGRGGQGDRDADGVMDLPGLGHDDRCRRSDHERYTPADGGQSPALPADGPLLEFHAGQEEQQAEPDLREQLDRAVHHDPAQHLRAEEDPGAEEEHDLCHLDPKQAHHEGHERRYRRDHEQRAELLGHSSTSGGSTMRRLAVSSLGEPLRDPSTDCSSGFADKMVST